MDPVLETNSEIYRLSIFDSIHDFWGDRADISPEIKLHVQTQLLQFIKQHEAVSTEKCNNEPKGLSFNKCLMNMSLAKYTNGSVSSATSNFENNVVKYFETQSSLRSRIKTKSISITYGQIIDAWKKKGKRPIPQEWEGLIGAIGINDELILHPGTHKVYNSFGMVQHHKFENVIAQFILNYLFPNHTTTCYFTFDAASGILGKLFYDINQVTHLITPANITDSASTSLNRFNGRNLFHFPQTTNNTYSFQSNIFSKSHASMKYTKAGFSNTQPYGFSYDIIPSSKSVSPFSVPFYKTGATTGPSVGYLSEYMTKPSKSISLPQSNMMKLTGLDKTQLLKHGIAFDIKRAGDYEQVNSAKRSSTDLGKVVIGTIDIMCCLYSRMIHQPVVLRNNETLKLYRFPASTVATNPVKSELQTLVYELLKTLQTLKLAESVFDSQLIDQIQEFQIACNEFMQNGKFLNHTFASTTYANVSYSDLDALTSIPEKIVDMVVKYKLMDVLNMLNQIKVEVQQMSETKSQISTIKTFITNVVEYIEWFDNFDTYETKLVENKPKMLNIIRMISPSKMRRGAATKTRKTKPPMPGLWSFDFEAKLTKLASVFRLSVNKQRLVMKGMNELELFPSTVFEKTNANVMYLKPVGEIASIGWANKPFHSLFSILSRCESVVHAKSSRLRDQNLVDKLTKMDYFKTCNTITNTFVSSELSRTLMGLLMPDTHTDTGVIEWYSGLLQHLQRLQPALKTAFTKRGGNNELEHVLQSIPSPSLAVNDARLRVQDLFLLLTTITSRAAAMVETAMQTMDTETETVSNHTLVSMMKGGMLSRKRKRTLSMSPSLAPPAATRVAQTKRQRTHQPKKSTPDVHPIIRHFTNPETLMQVIKPFMEDIAFTWETGLVEIYHDLDDVYEYTPTYTEFCLLKMMSFYSVLHPETHVFQYNTDHDETANETTNLVLDRTQYLFQSLSDSRANKRYETQVNDIAFLILATENRDAASPVPAEVANLLVLAALDNFVQPDKDGKIAEWMKFRPEPFSISNPNQWEALTDFIYTTTHFVMRQKTRSV